MNNIYSVRQVNAYIKNMFTEDFLLSRISVRGEVSNAKDHPSGHLYFTLKDRDAALSCVMFAGNRLKGLSCRLKDGMKVVVSGSVNIYEAAGKYELFAVKIEEEGKGDLYAEFLKLKERLSDMGMFADEYKKPIPKYARKVGIVTSASGAALHDIMNIAGRRNPYTELILSPALVQGESAPESIVHAIEKLDHYGVDVMIVGRGGGSMEDLWAFNDERVARAIFDCDTPVISAVGHETDFTIADFVSDLRAPTPSAAAELAVFEYAGFETMLDGMLLRMEDTLNSRVFRLKSRLSNQQLSLKLKHPANRLKENRAAVEKLSERLTDRILRLYEQDVQRLKFLSGKLDAMSPLSKLTNGFGYISSEGRPVRSAVDVTEGALLSIRLHDGTIFAKTEKTEVSDGK